MGKALYNKSLWTFLKPPEEFLWIPKNDEKIQGKVIMTWKTELWDSSASKKLESAVVDEDTVVNGSQIVKGLMYFTEKFKLHFEWYWE